MRFTRRVRATLEEKLETIPLVEGSSPGVERTPAEFALPRRTFHRWYQACVERGPDSLAAPEPQHRCFLNRIPQVERDKVVEIALAELELTPRELACHITDAHGSFISESSVYRILKGFDLVTSPAHIVLSEKDRFDGPTHRVHELWQTDFTYF